MPIKLPKGFQRRKSSGNVLDEVPPGESSFKVFPRPASSGQSLDMTAAQRKSKPLPGPRNSFEQEDEDLFTVMRPDAGNRYYSSPSLLGSGPDRSSGSGGTDKSLSVAQYDSAASSTRLSTSSTNPSSVDTRSDKNVQSHTPRAQSEAPTLSPGQAPAPPPHQSRTSGFLRNAGRTFSFGVRSQKDVPREESPPPPVPAGRHRFSVSTSRERAMTASSVSTTTPPRLLDSDLALNNTGFDSFGNMFDGIGKSREPSPARPSPVPQTTPSYTGNTLRPDASRGIPPRLVQSNKLDQTQSSPYSWTSETSRDDLMRSPSPPRTATQNSPQTAVSNGFRAAQPSAQYSEPSMEDNLFSETPSRPRAYSKPSRQAGPPPTSFPNGGRLPNPPPPQVVSPIVERPGEQDESTFDASLLDGATLATKYQETKPSVPAPKVMTPQQFERYRQQQDERVRMNKVFGKVDSDESGDDYDDEDEDETERDRQAVKQRKKQEAHLAVYRQTMIKVTGEPAPPNLPTISLGHQPNASASSSDFTRRLSTLNFDHGAKSTTGKSSDEDEDEDVPLGILAAHGFPNKNRPPTRLTSTGSNPNLRAASQSHAGAQSVAGESINRMSLPAFARKLPEDPYYGAGLVNQSNRESLAFHSQSTPNLQHLAPPPPSSGAATNHPHHPAGLVGVIAGEERARAARRGSPNPVSGQFDLPTSMNGPPPGMQRSHTMGQMPTMMMPGMMPGMVPGMPGMPPMMPPMSAGDHAQLQMSQQMTQMMQMQMQWMQQMQSMMMGGQGQYPPGVMPPPAPSEIGNLSRPQSVPLQNFGGPAQQRSMSTLDPSMANWNLQLPSFNNRPGSTYAPSIAPSERSNVGLAPRYRPVSIAPEPARESSWQNRTSTMSSSTFRPLSTMMQPKPVPTSTVRKVAAPAADDDDDDAGWAEMKAKKDKKQRTWKLRKGNNPLQELYNGSG